MKRLVVGACLVLFACDDGTLITHVDNVKELDTGDLYLMQTDGGIPTEIHGQALDGLSNKEMLRRLRPPGGGAQAIRWREVAVGGSVHGRRMVLHFNPSGPPNAAKDCRRPVEALTLQPQPVGFSVNLTICEGWQALAHGYLQSRNTSSAEPQDITRVMRALMLNIFTATGNDR